MQFTKKELKEIFEDIWTTLDTCQCRAGSMDELMDLPAKHFNLKSQEVKIRKQILQKIISLKKSGPP